MAVAAGCSLKSSATGYNLNYLAMEMVSQGDIPWSVYYRETATITPENLDKQKRLCIALQKGINWMIQHDAESFQPNSRSCFLMSPPMSLSTNGFRRDGMWTSTSVSLGGVDRWQVGLAGARLVKEPILYDVIVDDTPASAAQIEAQTAAEFVQRPQL